MLVPSHILSIILITAASAWICSFFFSFYLEGRDPAKFARYTRYEFTAETLGGYSYALLILSSLLGLYLELLLIRWISSEIPIFAYFKNFVLIACFLGFGLGCYLCRRPVHLIPMLGPLFTLAVLVTNPWVRGVIGQLPYMMGAFSEVHIWGVPTLPMTFSSMAIFALAVAQIIPIFALIAMVMIPLGQLVAWSLENSKQGITAYSVNVLASLAGILLYTALCFFYQPPGTWFAVGAVLMLLLMWKAPTLRWTAFTGVAVCALLVSVPPGGNALVLWSPYQKLTIQPIEDNFEITSYEIHTNDNWFQAMFNLSPQFVASHEYLFRDYPIEWNAYNIPYHFYNNPPTVLVLGSGSGNDVAAALRNGAGMVQAVEIDPLILEEGRRLHFEKPYSSPRVHVELNDARSYLQNSKDKFDLIVFSLLDSHTTSSHFSNLRIDNYVYTIEALESAKKLLKDDGVFVVKFWVDKDWIGGRCNALLTQTFGEEPLHLDAELGYTTPGSFYIAGSKARIAQAMSDPKLAAYVKKHPGRPMAKATPTTDDWPYFYQQEPGIPASVLMLSLALLPVCWIALRKTGMQAGAIEWHFFFLGAGFLLLEAQIISKMALLFGTTWVVNSIVISGLLLLIVAANLAAEWIPKFPPALAYAGIFLSMAASYLIRLDRLFFDSIWQKGLAATAVLCLPVFFAGIVFVRSFAQASFAGSALGSNLMGALAGGLLESLSMWAGIRALLIVAALCYLASFIRRPKQA